MPENTKRIYLDYAAGTPAEEAVILAMVSCMRKTPYNASSAYGAAGEARRVHREARTAIAALLNCAMQDVYFTSGGTEANNWALRAFSGAHVVLSSIEHASVLEAAKACGCSVTLVDPDVGGVVSAQAIERALTPQTRLIALQWANNETGVIQPVEKVSALARARRIHLHVDAVQAFGHVPVQASHCDSMAISAHKLYGPRGVGALYIRNGVQLAPLMAGGHQERGMRAGTENTPAICGFGVAARMAGEVMQLQMAREHALMDAFAARLARSGVRRLGDGQDRLPGIAALLLPGVQSETAIAALDRQGILVSGGAACASADGKPSHVYAAMGLSHAEAGCVLRVSIGRGTEQADLDAAAAAIEALIPPRGR